MVDTDQLHFHRPSDDTVDAVDEGDFELDEDLDYDGLALQRKIGGETVMHALEDDRNREYDTALDKFYCPYDPNSPKKVAAGCGDEREPTEETVAMVNQDIEGDIEKDGFARWFGGLAGATEIFALAYIMQYGIMKFSRFIGEHGEDFGKLMAFMDRRLQEHTNLVVYNHGHCAFIGKEGVITTKAGHSAVLGERSSRHQRQFFGETLKGIEHIQAAAMAVAGVYGTDYVTIDGVVMPNDLGINERNMNVSHDQMELIGQHMPAKKTKLVLNYKPRQLSNSLAAWKQPEEGGIGGGFYEGDAVVLAENLMKAVPEAQLDPEILLRVIDHIGIVTANELEGDGSNGSLVVMRRGTAEEALDYLNTEAQKIYSHKPQLEPALAAA